MKNTYEIKGIKLNMHEMSDISRFYERKCTADYLVSSYGISKVKAFDIACEVRDLMADYPGTTEEEAIDEVLSEMEDTEE